MKAPHEPQITRYLRWLRLNRQRTFDDYDALWQWSVTDLNGFWRSIWDYFEIESPTPPTRALAEGDTADPVWFLGTQLNYARQVFRHADTAHGADLPAILFRNERLHDAGRTLSLPWPELRREVASLAVALRSMGVQRHDRVAAYLPNAPQTVVAFLACASLGAVWSACSPDMDAPAVLDRFRQIAPKVLIACDGTTHGGRDHDRLPVVHAVLDALPSVQQVVIWPCLDKDAEVDEFARPDRRAHDLRPLLAGNPDFEPEWLPFDHPLWTVFSSGPDGQPQPVTHSHGGVVLETLKLNTLHNNLGATADTGDRFHWTASTGRVMWNLQVGGLLGGTTLCLFDGHPVGSTEAPDWARLWQFIGETGVTFFGASAAFHTGVLQADTDLHRTTDLSALRAVGSAGTPLAPACYDWLWAHLPPVDGRPIWITAMVGSTEIAGAFVGGLPTLPNLRGEVQCRCLGAAIATRSTADDDAGVLVCTQPMPSMPCGFWRGDGGVVWAHGGRIRLVHHPEAGYTGAIPAAIAPTV